MEQGQVRVQELRALAGFALQLALLLGLQNECCVAASLETHLGLEPSSASYSSSCVWTETLEVAAQMKRRRLLKLAGISCHLVARVGALMTAGRQAPSEEQEVAEERQLGVSPPQIQCALLGCGCCYAFEPG